MSIAIQVSFVTFISADNGISMGTGKAISIVVCGVICAGIWLQFQEFQLHPLLLNSNSLHLIKVESTQSSDLCYHL